MPDRKPGETSREYERAKLARSIPALLDNTRADGGVLRLLVDPGGKVPVEATDRQRASTIEPSLLVQGAAELQVDFKTRAALTPAASLYWSGIESLAGKPFAQGVRLDGPPELAKGGEWADDIDGQGTSIRRFLLDRARAAVGYGWTAILTEPISDEKGARPVWREVPPDSIVYVEPGRSGPRVVEITAQREGQDVLLRYESPEINGGRWATVATHIGDGHGSYATAPEKSDELVLQDTIPIDPIAAAPLSPSWFGLPLLLPAAKIDHTLLQIRSQLAFAVSQSLTFLRFAKGIDDDTINKWRETGPRIFYATTAENADMRFVTVPAEGVSAGVEYEEHLQRGVEVAVLAPNMTRMPGDEKATGQAIASAHARSAAEAMALMLQATSQRPYRRLARFRRTGSSGGADMAIGLYTNFAASSLDMEAAELKSKVYLDPRAGMERREWWEAMLEHGIVGEDANIAELVEWSRRANPERQKLAIERARLGLAAAGEGLFVTSAEGRRVLYLSMLDAMSPEAFGLDPSTPRAEIRQAASELAARLVKADADAGNPMGAGLALLADLTGRTGPEI